MVAENFVLTALEFFLIISFANGLTSLCSIHRGAYRSSPSMLSTSTIELKESSTSLAAGLGRASLRHSGRKHFPTFFATSGAQQGDTISADVLVIGAGPAARAIASLLSNSKTSSWNVCLADQTYDRSWVPNYGVWEDEWEAVSKMFFEYSGVNIRDCINRKWEVTDCFFGGSFGIPVEERFRINRPYLRVDRDLLRQKLSSPLYRVIRANHSVKRTLAPNIHTPAPSILHDESGSVVTLSDGTTVRTKVVIDCTGHESKLVLKDSRATDKPGYQIAYGAMAFVEERNSESPTIGPYDKEAMTLFDYRTDHFMENLQWLEAAEKSPTFMYVMPIKGNKIFFEETSLVARPAISFMECKERCLRRLEHLGVKITDIEEEEYCYIPMGGALPAKDQRVIGFGGATATVHPSTGYHLCRMLASAPAVATAIENELARPDFNPDRAAASAYHAVWFPENVRQRNFAVFGGEFLMKQNVEGLRGFFSGFFSLPLELWAGFLAGWVRRAVFLNGYFITPPPLSSFYPF
jgi:lycopene beta-cyclase